MGLENWLLTKLRVFDFHSKLCMNLIPVLKPQNQETFNGGGGGGYPTSATPPAEPLRVSWGM